MSQYTNKQSRWWQILSILLCSFISYCSAQCEPNFQYIQHSCFYFEVFDGKRGSWQDGITACDRRRAQFYTPISSALHKMISSKAQDELKSKQRQKLNWWTSLNDKAKEGKFEVYRISRSGATRGGKNYYEEDAGLSAAASTPYWESQDIGTFFPWNSAAVSPYKAAPDRNCVALRTELNGDNTYIDLNCDDHDGTGVICVKSPQSSDYSSSGDQIISSNNDDLSLVQRQCGNDAKCIYFHKKPWTRGEVYYQFEFGFPSTQQNIAISSMRKIEANVGVAPYDPRKRCITFKNRNNRTDILNYVVIKYSSRSDECVSNVGMYGGKQEMRLGEACFHLDDPKTNFHGIVIHELMHVLGFNHEHQRPDRDKYIEVEPQNFYSGAAQVKAQFEKLPREKDGKIYYDPTNDERYFEYDYYSLLHYGLTDFGSGVSPYLFETLKPLPDNRFTTEQKMEIGQRKHFSDWDIKRMQTVYCDLKLPRLLSIGNATSACDTQLDKLCYKLFNTPILSPPDASSFCESRGYQLVVATPSNYQLLDKLIDSRFSTGSNAEQCDKKLTFLGNWYQGIRPQTSVFTQGSACKKVYGRTAFDLCGSEFFDCSYADWMRTAPFVCVKDESGKLDSPYCARQIYQDNDYRYYMSCSNNLMLKPWPQLFPLCEPLSLGEYGRFSQYAFTSNASPLVNKNDQVAKFLARDSSHGNGDYLNYCTPGGTCTFEHAQLKPYLICRRPNTRPFESSAQRSESATDASKDGNLYKEISGQFWLRGTVPYTVDGFDQTLRAKLDRLMQLISEVTCVDFVRLSDDDRRRQHGDYVRFITPSKSSGEEQISPETDAPLIGGVVQDVGRRSSPRRRQQNLDATGGPTTCESNTVGRLGGEQVAVLSPACFDKPNLVLGVLMNILGIPADVVRPDRDNFVVLNPDKITTALDKRRLAKQNRYGKTQTGFSFDFESVTMFRYMQNLNDAPFVPQVEYGALNSRGLSSVDKQKLKKIYPCSTGDCSPQYGDGNCYYYESRRLNRTDAYHNCRQRGMFLAIATHDTFLAVDAVVDANNPEYEDFNCTAKRTMVSNWDPLLLDAPNTTAFTEGGGKCADKRNTFYIVCQSFACKKPEDWPLKLPSLCARPLRKPSKEAQFSAGLGIKRSILGVYCSYTFFEDAKYEYHVTCAQTINLVPDLPPMCEPLEFADLTDNLVHRAAEIVQYADFDKFGPYRGDARGSSSAPSRKIGFDSRTFNPRSPAEYLKKCVPNCRGFDVAKYIICRRPKTLQ